MHKFDINIKNLSKIEGHTHCDVKVRDGKVVESKLKISENKRFFTQAVTGLKYNLVPGTMARICGTCSSAHTLCSTETIEKALNLKVSEQTFSLRKLLSYAGNLRDHAMHLFFFCLPEIIGKDSVLDFKGKEKEWIHDGLHVKEAGNFLSTIVGGRAVHPPNAVVGGFVNFPSNEEIKEAINKLEDARDRILRIIEVFYNDKTEFKRKTNYVGLVNQDYNYLKGMIKTARGSIIPEEKYGDHLQRVVLPYSTATAFKWESKDFMVGALARMNLNRQNINKRTKNDVQKYLKVFPSDSVFVNNLAQSIEMLHDVDNSIDILQNLQIKNEKPVKPVLKASTGIGVVEAPRGTLYYHLDLDNKGIIKFANLCIPTQQNIIHLEKDIAKYVGSMLDKDKKTISLEVERMIRAYDPCMSCATHFLKINWV